MLFLYFNIYEPNTRKRYFKLFVFHLTIKGAFGEWTKVWTQIKYSTITQYFVGPPFEAIMECIRLGIESLREIQVSTEIEFHAS